MTSATESAIFVSPAETTGFVGEEWPLREDVFARDASEGGETSTFAEDPEAASFVERYAGETYQLDEAEPEYTDETYLGETDSYLAEAAPEHFERYGWDEAGPESAGETDTIGEIGPEGYGFDEVEPLYSDEDSEVAEAGRGHFDEGHEFDEAYEVDYEEPEYAAEGSEIDEAEPEYEPEYHDEGEPEYGYEADTEFDEVPSGVVAARQIVVDNLPMLSGHVGTPPDLILKWNRMEHPAAIDVVVHLHGFSAQGRTMSILKDKLPLSGLDFADPDNPASVGRTTPTLLVLPRGHYDPSRDKRAYHFPALTKPGGLQQLIDEALRIFARETGVTVPRGRLILTAHSGAGAAVMRILGHTDPDEIHTFDALYGDPAALIAWAQRKMATGSGALRVLYRAGEGTAKHSERVRQAAGSGASPRFRVERTTVDHNHIPRQFGWRLLADAGADLPGVSGSGRSAPAPKPSPLPAPTPSADRAAGRVRRGSFKACTGHEQQGARAMADQWRRLTGRKAETYNCRRTDRGAPSLHGEGRSVDLYANVSDRAQVEAYIAWMQANAVELQVAYIIWNRRQWSWERRSQGWRPYGGGNPHTDHIHVDLSWEGAQTPSPLFAGPVPGLGGSRGPSPAPTPHRDQPCPHCSPQGGALCGSIARIAEEQYRRWRPGDGAALLEVDPRATPILQDYYRTGVGGSVSAAELQSTKFQAKHPWSAVFISWVMRTAGAGNTFAYSRAHQTYVRAATQNRLSNATSSPFHAYRVSEVAPQVGDLVCKSRSNSGATYDNISDRHTRATHCDIVTQVRPGQIRVIGGNVNQTVGARTLRTNANGKLSLTGTQSHYFAIVRCHGVSAPQPRPAPTPRPSGGHDLGDAFFQELKAVSARLGCDPGDLLAVMVSESNADPAAQNPHGKATGLIQFMPQTLNNLGWTSGPDEFRKLTADQQLPYVEKFYRPYRGQLTSAGRLYQATFLPATLKNSNESTVIAAPGGPNAKAYLANKGLDTNKDGVITVSDLTERLNRLKQHDRWKSLAARL